jgi:hypothetical protein
MKRLLLAATCCSGDSWSDSAWETKEQQGSTSHHSKEGSLIHVMSCELLLPGQPVKLGTSKKGNQCRTGQHSTRWHSVCVELQLAAQLNAPSNASGKHANNPTCE